MIKKHSKFLSEAYWGSAHDYAILKNELTPEHQLWFDEHHLQVDFGFLEDFQRLFSPTNENSFQKIKAQTTYRRP